jgi:hypothetical protein
MNDIAPTLLRWLMLLAMIALPIGLMLLVRLVSRAIRKRQ